MVFCVCEQYPVSLQFVLKLYVRCGTEVSGTLLWFVVIMSGRSGMSFDQKLGWKAFALEVRLSCTLTHFYEAGLGPSVVSVTELSSSHFLCTGNILYLEK